jgi:AraC-like DNA-binding protein
MQGDVVESGNLSSPQRIIAGTLSQLNFFGASPGRARAILTQVGLPARALDEPDFPISLQQELEVAAALVGGLPPGTSSIRLLFQSRPEMGIENLGVIGMAMKHAATAVDSLRVCLAYPELTMGHCRMVVRRQRELALFSFHMERPQLRGADERSVDRLVEYCTVLDLSTSLRNIEDVLDRGEPPAWVSLPFPRPADWDLVEGQLDFPVSFDAEEACVAYPEAFDHPLPHANPLLYRMYASLAERMSQMLAEDVSLEERVTRWLWAYTQPPNRSELADLLAMSERSLTRQLKLEGTSYSTLLARVQSERAQNFLRSSGLSVGEIGYRLGYSEPAAFTRAFTHWTGESPLQWRRSRQ